MSEYKVTVEQNSLALSLSRTGGQGAKGDSITRVYVDASNALFIVISDAAGNVISTTNVGSVSAAFGIQDLTNVTISSASTGDTLQYNGVAWANQPFDSTVRNTISVTDSGGDGALTYTAGTGVIEYTGPSAAEARAHVSVTDSGGDGALTYTEATGVFEYTGPSAAEARAHFTGGTGIDIVGGVVAISFSEYDTDSVIEGVNNLYFTDARVAANAAVLLNTAKVTNVAHPLVETAVPVGAVFTDTDTVYDDTAVVAAVGLNTAKISYTDAAAVTLNTAKVTNVAHPLVETAVPTGAVFTDTNYVSSDFDHDALTNYVAAQHVDWAAVSAGTIHITNLPATALTSVQTAANQAAMLALTAQEGDVVVRSDELKTYMHNGGSAGTMADFTLLATPTDSVTSVDGATGVVTLNHDTLTGFVAAEHVDWALTNASNIHVDNYTNTEYVSSDFNHGSLTGYVAAEHVDWALTNAANIHADNYTDTVYDDTTLTSTVAANVLAAEDAAIVFAIALG